MELRYSLEWIFDLSNILERVQKQTWYLFSPHTRALTEMGYAPAPPWGKGSQTYPPESQHRRRVSSGAHGTRTQSITSVHTSPCEGIHGDRTVTPLPKHTEQKQVSRSAPGRAAHIFCTLTPFSFRPALFNSSVQVGDPALSFCIPSPLPMRSLFVYFAWSHTFRLLRAGLILAR